MVIKKHNTFFVNTSSKKKLAKSVQNIKMTRKVNIGTR